MLILHNKFRIGLRVIMRVAIPLFVLSLVGPFAVHEASATCNTSDVQLDYNQLGKSFTVRVSGEDQGYGAPEALKGSPEGAFTFMPTDVHAYQIIFYQGVQVDTFQFQIKQSASVRIVALVNGSMKPAYDNNVTTGGNDWRLGEKFDIDLSNVVRISVLWVATGSEMGLKNIVINVCATAPCAPGQILNTNQNLDPPSGFNIDIPGPPLVAGDFNDNPVAVFSGSESKVKLRNVSPGSYNYIKITSNSEFKVSEISIETKQGKGIYVVAFSDTTGDDVLFIQSKRIRGDVSNWNSLSVGNVIGPIVRVRRLDIFMLYGPDQQVSARNLYFNTCL